jgi:CubicO group peptidase (beta-lactamase class C family)
MTAAGRRGLLAAILMTIAVIPAQAQTYAQVDQAALAGIREGLYPGAVVIIGRRDSILYSRGYGHFTWNPASRVPNADSTLWDIASITKVVATAASAMRLVDQGRLDLDARVGRYLPRFSGGLKNRVTVRMLLDHTSGLKSYSPMYRRAGRSRSRMVSLLYAEPLVRPPGDSAAYSDLNAMLMGLVIESIAKTTLDRFADTEVFDPIGMVQTRFRVTASLKRRTAPSGIWRGEPVPGDVNDQNAAAFGGVAGHAGVFSTGRDLARFAQVWLREGMAPAGQWVSPATMRQFLTRGPRSGTRLLGWDSPELNGEEPSIYGTLITPSAYGHTGFTGTELWIDPAHDLFLVFLTNRAFDPRTRDSVKGLKLVRTELSDAAIRLVPQVCAQKLVATC